MKWWREATERERHGDEMTAEKERKEGFEQKQVELTVK